MAGGVCAIGTPNCCFRFLLCLSVAYALPCTIMILLARIQNYSYRLQRKSSINIENSNSIFILLPVFGVKGDVIFADTYRNFYF